MPGQVRTLAFVAFLILFKANSIWASLPNEPPVSSEPYQQLRFQSITDKDGLSSYKVRVMAQDAYGFMWFGADNGLDRFDGHHITQFRNIPENPMASESSLQGTVSCLLSEPEQDRIWIGTREGGLYYINVKTFRITRLNLGPFTDIRTIAWDRQGKIWVGAQNGLLHFNPKTLNYTIYNKENSKISNEQIRSIYEDSSGNLWVGTLNKLNRLNVQNNEFQSFDLRGDYQPINNNLILAITPYSDVSDSLLWIGTETGLCLFDRYLQTYRVYRKGDGNVISNDKVVAIYPADSLHVWVGTDFGLNLFNHQSETSQVFYHIPTSSSSLSNNKIYSIFEDQTGNIWFATDNGVNLLNRSEIPFSFYPVEIEIDGQPVGIEVNNIIADRQGNFWLATHQGVIHFSTQDGILKSFKHQFNDPMSLLADKCLDLYLDEFEQLWIATNKGINVWDPVSSRMHSFTANYESGTNGLRSQFTNSLVRARDGTFWVGTWDGGLHEIQGDLADMNSISFHRRHDVNSTTFTSDAKTLWIEENHKLFRMDLLTREFSDVESIQESTGGKPIESMIYSNKGSLWLGIDNGLVEYRAYDGSSQDYTLKAGRDIALRGMLEDDHGNIWCSSESSIIKFDVKHKQFEVFPIENDIPLHGFRPRSCCKTPDGKLAFGGQDGFIVIDPDEVSLSGYQSTIGISELHIQNERIMPGRPYRGQEILEQSIFFEDELTLRFNHRSLILKIASLHYGDLLRRNYAYTLEGYDNDWRYTSGEQSFAVYSNLPPGTYNFLLRGSNSDGVMGDHISSLRLRIKPPTWASPGVIALYVVVTLFLILLILYVNRNKARWMKKLEKIRVENERNEEMAMLKQRFFTNISHEFRTPLCLIAGPTHEILEKNTIDSENRKLVEIISKNSERMLRLVNQLIDFRKMEVGPVKLNESKLDIVDFSMQVFHHFDDQAERKNIDYSFTSEIENLEMSFDPGKMETVLYNLLSNAFNFTPAGGKISMELEMKNGTREKIDKTSCRIRVRDSGPGISSKEIPRIFDRFYQSKDGNGRSTGSGIGLTMVKEYVKLHGGKVTVKSKTRQGSVFSISLPVNPVNRIPDNTGQELTTSLYDDRKTKTTEEEVSAEKNTINPGNPVILLVEDNPEIIDYILLGLAEKYTFRFAENGAEAIQMVDDDIPDMIISDVLMPEMDGHDLCNHIRENPRTRHLPFIMISALTLSDQQIEGLKSGADAYITKPFIIKYLDALIENLFHKKELLMEYARMQTILDPEEIKVSSTDEKILKQVITFIESHISDPELNVQNICQATGFTHSYLYRSIKRMTGSTLNELIKDIRIKRAAQLLKSRKLSIAEVLVEVGFSNHSYFSKCFKKVYRVSPGNYLDSLE
jgi:signal transduction histidine kinase/ligand-binding sensor domain-containing protein/AraC-like DNA-binding protein